LHFFKKIVIFNKLYYIFVGFYLILTIQSLEGDMKFSIVLLFLSLFCSLFLSAQNNALILHNGAIINITGGAVLNVAQPHADGIVVTGAGTSYIQSEGETNRVAWHINNGTGNHVIPFGVGGTRIDMSYNVTTAGSASGALVASTYATNVNNLPLPSVYAPAVTTMDSTGFVGTNNHSLFTADRFWVLRDIGRPWATKPVSVLTFSYRDIEFAPGNTITESDLLAQYWNSSQWNPGWYTGSALLGVNNAAVNQVNSINAGTNGNLYTWILVARNHPLPIELGEFKANCGESHKPVIEWVTLSETNNSFFTLLRSSDGFAWETVANITGAGNSNTALYYYFEDQLAPEGTLYYRLMQQDFDGTVSEAGNVQVNCAGNLISDSFDMNVYSDNDHSIHITFNSDKQELMILRLFDMRGRLIMQQQNVSDEGLNHIVLDAQSLANASYLISITGAERTESKKFFLQ
jgi:hypothetical protein